MTSIKFPAGTYFVGDIGQVTSHETWTQFICRKDEPEFLRKYKGDTFRYKDIPVAMYSTFHGDGVFEDQDGREYAVDSGTVGCIPLTAVEGDTGFGQVIDFPEQFTCAKRKDGTIRIGNVIINTRLF